LQHEEIPPHLHLEELNPYITLENTPFSIPTELQSWSRGEKSRFAGVSAFSFGGTNAHVILEEAPLEVKIQNAECARPQALESNSRERTGSKFKIQSLASERPYHVLTLTAKSDRALQELAQRYADFLASHPEASLADICFTANTRRTHFDRRLCLVAESIAQLRQQLKSFIAQEKIDGVFSGKVKGRKRPKIAFFFPDDESASLGMGYRLYQTQPTFRQAFDRCADFLQPYLQKPLLAELEKNSQSKIQNLKSKIDQPALFAIEYSLAKLWYSWGIKPKAVMGCGVGEYVAATVAGVFSLEEALKLVAESTRLQQAERSSQEMVEAFAKIAETVAYSPLKIPFISTANGELTTKEIATAEYWCRHLQQTESAGGIEALADYQVVLAMGSKPISLAEKVECLSSFHPERKDWQEMLSSLGELFVRGVAIDWCAFDRDYSRNRLQLPTYPFQRQRYWFKSTENEEQLVAHQPDPIVQSSKKLLAKS
jgi:acyl transferase domain-containing protein